MANTTALVQEVEPYIREWLRKKYGVSFRRRKIALRGGAYRQFGAVSDDGSIVAAIRRSSGFTSGDNLPTGKIQVIFQDLHLLSLVDAKKKALVVTDEEFLKIIKAEMHGKFPPEIELLYCRLPPRLEAIVKAVRKSASEEMDRGKTSRG